MVGRVLTGIMIATVVAAANPPLENLALSNRGAMAYVSSFANTTDLYSENLIDGDTNSVWQAFDIALPQWVELRWPQTVTLERLALRPAAPTKLQAWRAERWDHGRWLPLGETTSEELDFAPVTASRVRATITQAAGLPVRLHGVEVLGRGWRDIESLRPYWTASYIWHDEPGRKIQVGKPRYFRARFTIPALAEVRSAFLQSRANDFYEAYLNGHKVAAGNVDIRAIAVKDALREGENVLAYEAEARSDPGWGLMELLGELTVNTASGVVSVASGGDWKSSASETDGWNLPGFDDSAWQNATVLLKPPQGPWGRIPFHAVAEGATVRVLEAQFDPPVAQPGSDVTVRLKLQPTVPLSSRYLLELRAGETEINRDRSNYEVARATIVTEPFTGEGWVEFKLSLPEWSPNGAIPIQLRAASLTGDMNLSFAHEADLSVTVQRPITPSLHRSNTPLFWALQSPSFERFHEYAKAGPKVFHLQIYPYRVEPDTDYSRPHLEFLDQHIRNLLRTVPDAEIIVELDLRASGAWQSAHPEALLLDAFGNPRAECVMAKEYQDAVVDYLKRVIGFIQSQPYAGRVIGYIPEFAPVPESCIGGVESNEGQVDRNRWTIGDWNPQALAAFREFLRKKYGSRVKKLRVAWKDDAVDFDTATPDREQIVAAAPDHNLFRDPRAGKMRADYLEFISSMVPSVFVEKVARTIKAASKGKARVGTYFGYVVENLRGINPPGTTQQNNHFWFPHVINSPEIDFFVSPLQYEYSRLAGDRFFPFQPYASVGLHKKLYVAEMDYRTFICGDATYGRQRSQQETVAVLQRDLASTLIGGSGAWFADWSSGTGRKSHGFFLDDQILATIGRAYEIYEQSQPSRDREGVEIENRSLTVAARPDRLGRKTTEIAVIMSSKSPWHQDCAYPAVIYNTLICSVIYREMAAIGAPFDVLLIDDLQRKDVRDQYKLFVFINPFYLTKDESKWIESLKGGGRTLLWFYAPGYVSDEFGLSVEQVSKTTGIGIQMLNERSRPMFRVKNGGESVTLESFGPQLNFSTIMPTEIFPNIAVEDPQATALGGDDQQRVRFAEKDFGSWRSIYSAVPNLPRSIRRQQGRPTLTSPTDRGWRRDDLCDRGRPH